MEKLEQIAAAALSERGNDDAFEIASIAASEAHLAYPGFGPGMAKYPCHPQWPAAWKAAVQMQLRDKCSPFNTAQAVAYFAERGIQA